MSVSIGKLVLNLLCDHDEKSLSKKAIVFPGLLFAFISKQIAEEFHDGVFAPAPKFMIFNKKLVDSSASKCPSSENVSAKEEKSSFGPPPKKFSG